MPHPASRRPTAVDRLGRAKTMTIPIIVTLTIAVAAVAATPAKAAPTKTVRLEAADCSGAGLTKGSSTDLELDGIVPGPAPNAADRAGTRILQCGTRPGQPAGGSPFFSDG